MTRIRRKGDRVIKIITPKAVPERSIPVTVPTPVRLPIPEYVPLEKPQKVGYGS